MNRATASKIHGRRRLKSFKADASMWMGLQGTERKPRGYDSTDLPF
jgi:hypothetical protein